MGYLCAWWTFQAWYRKHRNTRPPAKATAAATTIIVVVVLLEKADEVDVCDGDGGAEVAAKFELVKGVLLEARWLVDPGRDVVLAVATAGF